MAEVFIPTRRSVLVGAAVTPLVALLAESRVRAAADAPFAVLTGHQKDVLTEATARLVPGPMDDPAELGHPGAREANVVRYIDTLLSAFDPKTPAIFAGGPWSNRNPVLGSTDHTDYMATFIELEERQLIAWKQRVNDLRTQVAAAVTALDAAAKADGFADFKTAPTVEQDRVLAALADVRDLLFGLTIDGMYSVPEYGGNAGLVGWQEIKWPGDSQPLGYSALEVEKDDGLDPVGVNDLPAVQQVLASMPAVAQALLAQGGLRG